MEKVSIKCKVAVSGNVRARLLYSKDSFCFWGGADPQSGLIRDNRSDCYEKNMAGQVFHLAKAAAEQAWSSWNRYVWTARRQPSLI